MKVIITTHARVRMKERGISQREIEECVFRPEKTHKESESIRRFQKSFAYGTIEVVAEIRSHHFIVITTYPL